MNTTTTPAPAATRTLRFEPNGDPMSPTAGLLTITSGKATTCYIVTEFASRFPGRDFHLAKVGGGEGYSVHCSHRGPEADGCECPAGHFRGRCKHAAAVRRLVELGRI